MLHADTILGQAEWIFHAAYATGVTIYCLGAPLRRIDGIILGFFLGVIGAFFAWLNDKPEAMTFILYCPLGCLFWICFLQRKSILKDRIKKNPDVLKGLPDKLKSPELCLLAMQRCDSWNKKHLLEYIPERSRTPMLYAELVEFSPKLDFTLVPAHLLKTSEFWLALVKRRGYILSDVPKQLLTKEICLEAVRQDSNMLYRVPDAMKTQEVCFEALKEDCYLLKYVPENMQTDDFLLEVAAKINPFIIRAIADERLTEEICRATVWQEGDALQFVPEKLKTHDVCLEAVKDDGEALQFVPKELLTKEICTAAVQRNPSADFWVPAELKDAVRKSTASPSLRRPCAG